MSTLKKSLVIILLALLLLIGLGCILYSPFATWYNERHKAQVQAQFQDVMENVDNSAINAQLEAAIKYNEDLYHQSVKKFSPDANGYSKMVNLTGNGMMGFVRIPCINVSLPIYHTVNANVLNMGAGHMPETSLPVGGENTHSVISAHSGMAGSAMFSELERMRIGDFFHIDVLGKTLTYQVIRIDVVTPDNGTLLKIEPDEDLVTLLTCTPYGINSHRLLVRGTRVYPEENAEIQASIQASTENRGMPVRTRYTIIAIAIGCGLGILLVASGAIAVRLWRRKREKSIE